MAEDYTAPGRLQPKANPVHPTATASSQSVMTTRRTLALLAVLLCLSAQAAERTTIAVQLDPAATTATDGRLIVFAVPEADAQKDKDGKVTNVDVDGFAPDKVTIAAQEVTHLAPRASIVADLDTLAFPASFSKRAPGRYYVQAVLDVDHDYNYSGREAGDWASAVVPATLGAGATLPRLTLSKVVDTRDPWDLSHPFIAAATRAAGPEARTHATHIDFESAVVSRFYGHPMKIPGWVLTPPGYEAGKAHYPTVYMTLGWNGNVDRSQATLAGLYAEMRDGRSPKMIWVLLGMDIATGAHEFTDSVNNGPWGEALVRELIPDLERRFRMDARTNGRFTFGHSSGGWAALSMQILYPATFGGAFATSPDPADFRDFMGPDLYAPGVNMYRRPDGSAWPAMRDDSGQDKASAEDLAKTERVFGDVGGQLASFEAVFSPRGGDGRPMPLFDRDTGAVDPVVAKYWCAHYDLAQRLRTQWPLLRRDLDGKLHVWVGTADTFFLDGPAHRLQQTLDGLGAKSEFHFLEGRTHGDVYTIGEDRNGLRPLIARAMYKLARP